MRLKRQHQAPPRVAVAQRLQARGNLRRVMAVVIHDRHGSGPQRHITHVLQSPVDTLEGSQCSRDGRILDAQLRRDRDRGQCVADVMRAGKVQGHRQCRTGTAACRGP